MKLLLDAKHQEAEAVTIQPTVERSATVYDRYFNQVVDTVMRKMPGVQVAQSAAPALARRNALLQTKSQTQTTDVASNHQSVKVVSATSSPTNSNGSDGCTKGTEVVDLARDSSNGSDGTAKEGDDLDVGGSQKEEWELQEFSCSSEVSANRCSGLVWCVNLIDQVYCSLCRSQVCQVHLDWGRKVQELQKMVIPILLEN